MGKTPETAKHSVRAMEQQQPRWKPRYYRRKTQEDPCSPNQREHDRDGDKPTAQATMTMTTTTTTITTTTTQPNMRKYVRQLSECVAGEKKQAKRALQVAPAGRSHSVSSGDSGDARRPDNQVEHERDTALDPGKTEPRKEELTRKATPSYVRKKKWKPHEEQHEPAREPDAEATTAAALSKAGELSEAPAQQKAPGATVDTRKRKDKQPADAPASETADGHVDAKKSQHRAKPVRKQKVDATESKRKKTYTYQRKDGRPTLLKQLLWKAKVTPPAAPSPTSQPIETHVFTELPVDDDEELSFTRTERQAMKMHATAVKESEYPMESSSQETQSGSEDEAFACAHYGDDEPHLESAESGRAAVAVGLDAAFPAMLPVDRLALMTCPVREIVLEDFVFNPRELHVQRGDVVVWRASEQTLGMVEQCLDLVFTSIDGTCVCTSSPPLRAGDAVAWRFVDDGTVHVECSVYHTKGCVVVGEGRSTPSTLKMAEPKQFSVVASAVAPSISDAPRHVTPPSDTDVCDSEVLEVFHPSQDLTKAAEQDSGVCREVLLQLEEVERSTASVIMVGDVACPLLDEDEDQLHIPVSVGAVDTKAELAEVMDFKERIISMLKKSEESQRLHRESFIVRQGSMFDAEAAYDFFKQRFSQLTKEDSCIIYPLCPELCHVGVASEGDVLTA